MRTEINGNLLELKAGDITRQRTEAIVNAANGSLLGGGGVDGAIHRAAGKELLEECKRIRKEVLNDHYLPTGEAVLTKGYQLPASYVIHTVGPVWNNRGDEPRLLANCYQNSLELSRNKGVSSISFPSISTGVYGYPINQAAPVALQTIINFLQAQAFGDVVMTLFSEQDYQVYKQTLKELL
ncbi:O-acetyl-ADP-ribose deacetylase (regulator of RNase III), contains Macro domain [Salinibacillus kushneri]|uniref:O-acetyl-ADP-ribose deacetylase (Regulator of RNase III), contains Macro domain n=1 Tax=Salinibacillus kushneri TaxID=237682 RepID=A0A1I0CFD2_9BACI|nr:O-acetyl-ADP-ribose deacetylase [Salinibacillus kushneri]SET18311.1 O-acetyl-ADP-ribose deacetylase (regulator of RNase III), contains Macro domain [Salinibacillus kushneri]